MRLIQTRIILLGGRVQGVGFRPFVYRLADRFELQGWVKNRSGQVEIVVQGRRKNIHLFEDALIRRSPPLSNPSIEQSVVIPPVPVDDFCILPGSADDQADIHIPADYFTCPECLAELNDPTDRRYHYPFINCTQCGPRYTLIKALPYDRKNTTMAGFELCPRCRSEYEDPLDGRFHAEPVACPACGPQLAFNDNADIEETAAAALDRSVEVLKGGGIIAVKGIGGYHLMCDAQNSQAILRLRGKKPRPHKPLAVMFSLSATNSLEAVLAEVFLDKDAAAFLQAPMRPVLLATKKPQCSLSPDCAPGLNEIGVMLPYSPLHHLLLDGIKRPLVATSANISGEPVFIDKRDIESRLGHVAEAFLHHDRPIERPADDPVFRFIADKPRPIRLGRGVAPMEFDLPFRLENPVLAVGGQMKNTVALAWENRIVVSPHIGDMGTPRSMEVFTQVIDDLQSLYEVRAGTVICDAHPGYATTHWAENSGLPVARIFHHYAHASAISAEGGDLKNMLVFAWDGVGFGADGSLWGGETLLGRPGDWRRVGSFRPFYLPGGDRVSREPWRSAASLCWELGIAWPELPGQGRQLYEVWSKKINCPRTSAVGRLFDAAAAFTGLCLQASYEGQGPMMLEAFCAATGDLLELPMRDNESGLRITDWSPLVRYLLEGSIPARRRAMGFHVSMANAALQQALYFRQVNDVSSVGLAGGVFQNRVLTELITELLRGNGFEIIFPQHVPVNDGGLCVGQVFEYSYG